MDSKYKSYSEACKAHGAVPKDLGGFQQVLQGEVEDGDLLIDAATGWEKQWAWGYVGTPVSDIDTYRAYRRMPVPAQGVPTPPPTPAESAKFHAHKAQEASGKALTFDDGKAPLARIPSAAKHEIAKVLAYGHKKYSGFNNFRKGMEVMRQLDCAERHIDAYIRGETIDPESGCHHLAHAATRLMFVLQNEKDGVLIDDRYRA